MVIPFSGYSIKRTLFKIQKTLTVIFSVDTFDFATTHFFRWSCFRRKLVDPRFIHCDKSTNNVVRIIFKMVCSLSSEKPTALAISSRLNKKFYFLTKQCVYFKQPYKENFLSDQGETWRSFHRTKNVIIATPKTPLFEHVWYEKNWI